MIVIRNVTSECYLGPRIGFMFRNLVIAHAVLFEQDYQYTEYINEQEHPPGNIPLDFMERARLAFARRHRLMSH